MRTAIFKAPASGRVAIRGVNLEGDDQADRSVHGGRDKAVYAYSAADYAWWGASLGSEPAPGTFGENVTVAMVGALGDAIVGERWLVGTSQLEVCQPRLPCYKLGMRMGDPMFVKRFAAAGRPGSYLRIVQPGDVGSGDLITLLHRPDHKVSVGLVGRALLGNHDLAAQLAVADALPEWLMEWVQDRLSDGGLEPD
ncbi:MAG: MOSC domain-containing protein [Candidatus Dormiibacterota bacterium]